MLRSPSELEKSTTQVFRSLFETFWYQCGYAHPPVDKQVGAYWAKLREYPEKIIMDMFESFIRSKADRCPPVEAMAAQCRADLAAYKREYEAQTGRSADDIGPSRGDDYGRALMRVTANLIRQGLTADAYQVRLRQETAKLEKEYPIRGGN